MERQLWCLSCCASPGDRYSITRLWFPKNQSSRSISKLEPLPRGIASSKDERSIPNTESCLRVTGKVDTLRWCLRRAESVGVEAIVASLQKKEFGGEGSPVYRSALHRRSQPKSAPGPCSRFSPRKPNLYKNVILYIRLQYLPHQKRRVMEYDV